MTKIAFFTEAGPVTSVKRQKIGHESGTRASGPVLGHQLSRIFLSAHIL
jgi:hypothetical protein